MIKSNNILFFIVLVALNFSCSSIKIVSGKIHGSSTEKCIIADGKNTKNITCDIKKGDNNNYLVELNFKKTPKKEVPTCVFDGFGSTNKMKNIGSKVETINTLISTSQVWIEIPSIKANPLELHGDMIMQFICIL